MTAKILIKRRFKKGKPKEIISLLNELRTRAMDQPGYISGMTMVGHNDPQLFLVIGTWRDIEDWLRWKSSGVRHSLEASLEIYQEGETNYEEYVLGPPHS